MRIFCIIGKSSSGKDTVFKRVMNVANVHPVVMSTTRPIRPGEVDGIDYHYTDDSAFRKALTDGLVIEHRTYSTAVGPWTYFTTNDSFQVDGDYLTVTTIDGVLALIDHFGADVVVPIYVTLDDGVRLQRALTRELTGNRYFVEMCRRFISDDADFAHVNLNQLKNLITVYNNDIDECVGDVVKILNGSD